MFAENPLFVRHPLDAACAFLLGTLPAQLRWQPEQFEALWALHPEEYHEIRMPGGPVKTPRWQQAYGADYHYTGRTNKALPVPQSLEPLFSWTKEAIDPRLNGILLNWYDGRHAHYIGKHRDSTKEMVEGAPIVTVSLGEERVFRLRPWKGEGYQDFPAPDGTVFVMPYETNLRWTHEVPHFERYRGRRISVTIRAFATGVLPDRPGQD
jgi:alkylated DNA repair dioxygenase AlkB